jgi:hypothetical protein
VLSVPQHSETCLLPGNEDQTLDYKGQEVVETGKQFQPEFSLLTV